MKMEEDKIIKTPLNLKNKDMNKNFLSPEISQSPINPLNKSRENLFTSKNNNDLFTAIEYNNIQKVKEILSQDNSSINELNEEGLSPLHIAVIKANIKLINLLLSNGADANIISEKMKQTPLHLAYMNQNSMTEEIIKELLKHNADEKICDVKNKKPSDYMFNSIEKSKNLNNENNNNGNTLSYVTIDNHLDSFLTNKEEENKNNNQNNEVTIETPKKQNIDFDFNEIISINNSVEKREKKKVDENLKDNLDLDENKREYTFGREEDHFKFQKNNEFENNNNLENVKKIEEEKDKENEQENEIFNDSLNENLNEDNKGVSIDSLKNKQLQNEALNSFNINSLTYTESLNVNASNNKSKANKNFQIEYQNNIILKPSIKEEKKKIEENKEIEENKDIINDNYLIKLIKNKRNFMLKKETIRSSSLTFSSKNHFNNLSSNILSENEPLNNTFKTNRSNKINNLSTLDTRNGKDNIKYKNQIKNSKEKFIYNNLINNNFTFKNNNTIIGTDTRMGFSGKATQYSTQSQNYKMKNIFTSKDKEKAKVILNEELNNKITEFYYEENEKKDEINQVNENNLNLIYLKFWLNNLGLIDYLKNFTSKNIYDINVLVQKMKSYQTKLNYDSLESLLNLRKPGYTFRILCKLEADAGLIDPKIIKFMVREGPRIDIKNRISKSANDKLNLSISNSYSQCINCCKLYQTKKNKKNDLENFLIRYNLENLYQNFNHNGFDLIEYLILQMYSSFPINEEILENYLHIYDEKQRSDTLKAIVTEMKIINRFMNSAEYNNCDKNEIKYDNVIFEGRDNKEKSKICLNHTEKNQSNCIIF